MKKVKILLTMFLVLCVCSVSAQKVINEDLYLGEANSITSGWGKKLFFRGTNHNQYDEIYMGRYYVSQGKTDLRVSLADDIQNDDRFVVGNYFSDNVNVWRDLFVVTNKGWVGIGGVSYPQNALDVNGTIRAKEVKVETGWADFVFAPDYQLPTLGEVETHIKEHKHLPGIPTEAEVKKDGANLGEMNVKLLQKVEELTLYMIQQNKEIESLKKEVQQLKGK